MNIRFKKIVRNLVPFPLRIIISNIISSRGFLGIFGRLRAGGINALISDKVLSNRWKHIGVGEFSIINRGTQLHSNDNLSGKRILIGKHCYIGQNCFFSAGELILIKDHCNIGASCNLLAAGHIYDDPNKSYATSEVISYGQLIVGPNVWVGAGCTLVGDIQIGFGSIVAAGSVLRISLPPLSLAAGNPARIIKLYDWIGEVWINVPHNPNLRDDVIRTHLLSIPTEAEYSNRLKF